MRSSSWSAATCRGRGLTGLDKRFVINVDHHPGNTLYGAINWFDERACACGEMVADIIDALERVAVACHGPISTSRFSPTRAGFISATSRRAHSNLPAMRRGGCESGRDRPRHLRQQHVGPAAPDGRSAPSPRDRGRRTPRARQREPRDAGPDRRHAGRHRRTDQPAAAVREIEAVAFFKEISPGFYRISLRSKGDVDVNRWPGHSAAAATERGRLLAERPLPRDPSEAVDRVMPGLTKNVKIGSDPIFRDGVIVVDKPVGPTSHDIVAVARRITRLKKVGHTGTLDPLASGVLPWCWGRATRLAQFLTSADKEYEADIELGVSTTTFDRAGDPVHRPDARSAASVSTAEIAEAVAALRGTYLQQPPPFSAKKIAGDRAYDLARRSEPTVLRPVEVTARALDIISLDGARLRLRLVCSAGFYVRALAQALGERLGTGAFLASLVRTRSGDFTLESAVSLEELDRHPVRAAGRLVSPRPAASMAAGGHDDPRRRLAGGQRGVPVGQSPGAGRSRCRVARKSAPAAPRRPPAGDCRTARRSGRLVFCIPAWYWNKISLLALTHCGGPGSGAPAGPFAEVVTWH